MSFITEQGSHWILTKELMAKLSQAHPAIDIMAEAKKAALWIETNPRRRKTATGMAKFLAGWLSRASGCEQPQPKHFNAVYLQPEDLPDFAPAVLVSP